MELRVGRGPLVHNEAAPAYRTRSGAPESILALPRCFGGVVGCSHLKVSDTGAP